MKYLILTILIIAWIYANIIIITNNGIRWELCLLQVIAFCYGCGGRIRSYALRALSE